MPPWARAPAPGHRRRRRAAQRRPRRQLGAFEPGLRERFVSQLLFDGGAWSRACRAIAARRRCSRRRRPRGLDAGRAPASRPRGRRRWRCCRATGGPERRPGRAAGRHRQRVRSPRAVAWNRLPALVDGLDWHPRVSAVAAAAAGLPGRQPAGPAAHGRRGRDLDAPSARPGARRDGPGGVSARRSGRARGHPAGRVRERRRGRFVGAGVAAPLAAPLAAWRSCPGTSGGSSPRASRAWRSPTTGAARGRCAAAGSRFPTSPAWRCCRTGARSTPATSATAAST